MTSPSIKKQRGFTIVELLIVLSIVGLLSVFGIPFIRGILIEGKIEPTASDISKVVTKIRGNFAGGGVAPYGSLDTALFANTARGLTAALPITTSTSGTTTTTTIAHDLGSGGTVVVATATIGVANDGFTVTLDKVNEAACPGLASQLNRAAEAIKVNDKDAKTTTTAYSAATAQVNCKSGDNNKFVFTFR